MSSNVIQNFLLRQKRIYCTTYTSYPPLFAFFLLVLVLISSMGSFCFTRKCHKYLSQMYLKFTIILSVQIELLPFEVLNVSTVNTSCVCPTQIQTLLRKKFIKNGMSGKYIWCKYGKENSYQLKFGE